ncbi:subtilisin family serine protease [Deinobacterium chartae]|uniref:Subtilisin family serine protease n=1 Tax=Deinobacterium chartae TaxID=521158 RepID=A0A841I024_9DEIO|nr:S8 family serine peptidase [Deinobacterium chartae]MBB6099131.1 subtilisin family serine protease [Deinobacterium chartae]
MKRSLQEVRGSHGEPLLVRSGSGKMHPGLALLLPLVLAACGQTPSLPSEQDVVLTGGQAQVSYPSSGAWQVSEIEGDWLQVSPQSGQGAIRLKFDVRGDVCLERSEPYTARVTLRTAQGTTTALKVRYDPDVRDFLSGAAPQSLTLNRADVAIGPSVVERRAGAPAPRALLVRYRSEAAARSGLAQPLSLGSAETRTVRVPTDNLEADLARLSQDPDVESVRPEPLLRALGEVIPTDEYYRLQWAFPKLGYPRVWADMETGAYSNPVTVAVIDTGVRYDHPDLEGALLGPDEGAMDFVDDGCGRDRDPTDPSTPSRARYGDSSHGTHVTGIIAARFGTLGSTCPGCSSSGVVGAVYRAPVRVLPLRTLATNGFGGLEETASAIRYAAGETVMVNGAARRLPESVAATVKVINLSLGGPFTDPRDIALLCDAVKVAADRGIAVLAAGGNEKQYGNAVNYPAACKGATAVAATTLAENDSGWTRAKYSNTGPYIALSAPGGDSGNSLNGQELNGAPFPDMIFSTDWMYTRHQPRYSALEGTSQAAPQASALTALVLAKGLVSTPAQAVERLEQTALDLGPAGRDEEYGHGLIDPLKALGIAP